MGLLDEYLSEQGVAESAPEERYQAVPGMVAEVLRRNGQLETFNALPASQRQEIFDGVRVRLEASYPQIFAGMRPPQHWRTDLKNQVKTYGNEGIYQPIEGVTRLARGLTADTAVLSAQILEGQRDPVTGLPFGRTNREGPGARSRYAQATQALGGAESRGDMIARDTAEKRRLVAESPGVAALDWYATAVQEWRQDVRGNNPVDREFAESLFGQVVGGFSQLATQLPAYAIPGAGPAMAVGQLYQEGYDDALAHGASPEEAHHAGLMNAPSASLEYVGDRLILGRVLRPLKGKMKVKDLIARIGASAASEGATEGAQQLWQNIVASQLSGYDPERALDDEIINSLVVGAIVGGGATSVGTAPQLLRAEGRAKATVPNAAAPAPQAASASAPAAPEVGAASARPAPMPPADMPELDPADMPELDPAPPELGDAPRTPEAPLEAAPILARLTAAGEKAYEVDVPVAEIVVNKDVPQFKEDADPQTGVVDENQLEGPFDEVQAGRIVVWEKADGEIEVITGRHRLDLARRRDRDAIAAYLFKENDGFTQEDAIILDAEFNIRDGQGKVKDYAHYFKNAGLTQAEALDRGLLSRDKGRQGWALGQEAVQGIYDLYANNRLAQTKAVAIAQGAPGNAGAQMLAVRKANAMTPDQLRFYTQQVARMEGVDPAGTVQTGFADLLGEGSDFARLEAEAEQVAMAQAAMLKEVKDRIKAGANAARNPAGAKALGIDVTDPAATLAQVEQLREQARALIDPDEETMNAIRQRAGLQPLAAVDAPPATATETRREFFDDQAGGFALVGDEVADPATATKASMDRMDSDTETKQVGLFGEDPGSHAVQEGAKPQEHSGRSRRSPRPFVASPELFPGWAEATPETPKGTALVRAIARDPQGRRTGPRAIVDYVNRLVGVEMRRSTAQTSRRNPAHYRPRGHLVFTNSPGSQINLHEAGHGLKELLESRYPDFFKQAGAAVQALVDMPGSMASANNVHEGMAEWVRRRIMEPHTIEALPITPIIDAALQQHLPGVAQGLRDATRAYKAHMARGPLAIWKAENVAPRDAGALPVGAMVNSLVQQLISAGQPLRRFDRMIFRQILKNRKQVKLTLDAARKLARENRRTTRRLQAAYNAILGITAEVQAGMTGTGRNKGIRLVNEADNFETLDERTFEDLRRGVGARHWSAFEAAGWARTALYRYKRYGMDYPGRANGVTQEVLQQIVDDAGRTIPNFDEHYKAVESWFDNLLALEFMGGLKSAEEIEKIKQAHGDYWPLAKQLADRGVSGGPTRRGDVDSSLRRARGSQDPIRSLTEVAEDRLRSAYRAYYWNRFAGALVGETQKMAKNKRLPFEVRALAGRMATPLKLKSELKVTVSPTEQARAVVAAVHDLIAEQTGRPREEIAKEVTVEDIDLMLDPLEIWRPTQRPNEIQVMGFFDGGARRFVMLGDPDLFRIFAANRSPNAFIQFLQWAVGPSTRNFQRAITNSLPFGVNNVAREAYNQMLNGRGPVAFMPGGQTLVGMWNKLAGKYPQLREDGLLLSRTAPSSVEIVNRMRHGAIWRFFSEGLYVSHHRNPAVRFLATVLQPANWLYPVYKAVDVINLVGGRQLAVLGETATREGAAAAAKLQGQSDLEAKLRYWEVSGQFNEVAGSPDAAALYKVLPFFNPMLQSTRQYIERLSDPDIAVSGAAWTKLAMVAGIGSLSAAISYLTMSDEEREKERERTIADRMNTYRAGPFRLQFPYGPEGALMAWSYNAVMDEALDRHQYNPKQAREMLIRRVFDLGQLIEMNTGLTGPQLTAVMEANRNWSDFYQQHIVSPWLTGLPAAEQVSPQTPEFYAQLGQMFNYSPDRLQYIVQQGLARQADELVQVIDDYHHGRDISRLSDMPFVGRLFLREPMGFGSASMQAVVEVEQKLDGINARLRRYDLEFIKPPKDGARGGVSDFVLTEDQLALRQQLRALQGLQDARRMIDRVARSIRENPEQPEVIENARRLQTMIAQAALAGNPAFLQDAERALDALDAVTRETQSGANSGTKTGGKLQEAGQ